MLVACGGGGDGGTTPNPIPAAFTVSLSSTTLSIEQGGAGTATASIGRTGGHTTTIDMTLEGLPTGVTASFNPAAIAASTTTTTLNVNVAGSVAPGAYQFTIRGTAGADTKTAAVTLTVTAPAASITLTASPAALSAQAGGAGQSTTINIARTNFPGAVTLAASGQPSGVTPTFTVSPTSGNSAVFGVLVAGSVAPGTYTITITGSGSGISNATTTLSLTVTPASSGSNVVYTFCPASGTPVWFAAQNGAGGSWGPVTSNPHNVFTATISGIGGVAYVMQGGSAYYLTISYGTATELAAEGMSICPSTTLLRKSVTGTVAGFGTGNADLVSVAFGGASASPPNPTFAVPNFSIVGALDGVRDLIGTRSTLNIADPRNLYTVNKIFLKRGLNPANFGSVGTVDFNGADAFAPDTKQVTINGLVGNENQAGAFNSFTTANQSATTSLSSIFLASGNTVNLTTVPSAKTVPGDLQNIYAFASTFASPTASDIRAVSTFFRDPSNQTVTLGPSLSAPTVTAATTAPYARMRTQLPTQSQYLNLWITSYVQTGRSATIKMTAGYLGGAATFDVTIPDYTGIGTWQSTWGIQPGVATSWVASAIGFLTGSGGLVEGTTYRIGQRTGRVTP